jgi:hypothetical protein
MIRCAMLWRGVPSTFGSAQKSLPRQNVGTDQSKGWLSSFTPADASNVDLITVTMISAVLTFDGVPFARVKRASN